MYFEDFGVGLQLTTRGRTVFDHDIGAFVGLSGMYEQLFMNREYYETESVFRRRVAPGLLTLLLAEGLHGLQHGSFARGIETRNHSRQRKAGNSQQGRHGHQFGGIKSAGPLHRSHHRHET